MGAIIGLLGGVASGKSTVAGILARRGLQILDADAEARAVVAEPEVLAALVERFGSGILDDRGRLDRPALAAAAFADPESTAALNALVHPAVRARLEAALEAAAAAGRPVVLDVPLLLESPLAERVTTWIFIESRADDRDARTTELRGWDAGERARREARQADLAAKRARADHILENSGTIEDLERSIDALLARLSLDDA